MKTQQQSILTYTGYSEQAYEKILRETLLMCLSEISRDPQHLQLLLINKPINKWYLREVGKINDYFFKSTQSYKDLQKEDLQKSYKMYIRKIPQNYPGALIKHVKVKNPLRYDIYLICN